ncbi:PD-(D/E)XK motif protein [Nocardia brasiliensis]|uniref:PD-(D/E)XK motif protein n=1 Tax=Nocardia brasiliensis TaxID=37326 RepID=UPI00245631C5|nr:PD-(D/E)XK motif protein [Nocardia brasiliensis]
MAELSRRWAVLGSTSGNSFLVTSTIEGPPGSDVRVGVDRSGARHLLVAVTAHDQRVPEDVVGALRVSRQSYSFDGTEARYLDVECIRADLFDLFDEVLMDILRALNDVRYADTAVEVIERWRSLLSTHGRRLLSQAAQIGLTAELYVLTRVFRGRPVDIECWRGPLGEPHDLLLTECAIEVKAIGPKSRLIEIHGPTQLESPGRPLALVMVELVESEVGFSLATLAEELIRTATDRTSAIRRLNMAGYSPVDAQFYTAKFTVESIRFVTVDRRIPRIVAAAFAADVFPSGIAYLSYGIELAALEPFTIRGETALMEWIQHPEVLSEGWMS